MTQLNIFVPLQKIDEENRLVYGTVAAEELDNSGEMFDYESSKPYFQKWSDNAHATSGGKSRGNLRVMHTAKVAGMLTDLQFDDNNKRIECCAKVVDDEEWRKVEAGCYTGFSMGGRYVARLNKGDEKRYTADPAEVSLVDKPCIRTAVFDVVKADGLTEQRHFSEDVTVENEEELAKGWDESKYKRDPGGEGGGQFIPKDSSAADEGEDDESSGNVNKDFESVWDKADVSAKVNKDFKYYQNATKPGAWGLDGGKTRDEMYTSWATNFERIGVNKLSVAAGWYAKGNTANFKSVVESAKADYELASKLRSAVGAKKSDEGDSQMTIKVPTNDEMLPVARKLAKAAGKPEDSWPDFMEAAKVQLSKGDGAQEESKEETPADESGAGEQQEIEKGDKPKFPKGDKDASDEDLKAKEKELDDEADAMKKEGDDSDEGAEKSDDKKAEKADKGDDESATDTNVEPVQKWEAPDGQTFVKKADCLAHIEKLQKGDTPLDELRKLADKATSYLNGDELPDDSLIKYAGFYEGLAENEGLQKSMYHVERMANLCRSAASLQLSVSNEAKREGDGSSLPEEIMSAVDNMGKTLVSMAQEEVNEMTAYLRNQANRAEEYPSYYDDYCELADTKLDLKKADLESKSQERFEELQKVDAPKVEDDVLQKMDGLKEERDNALAKVDALQKEQDEMKPVIEDLKEKVEKMLTQPRPAAPRMNVVEKGAGSLSGGVVTLSDGLAKMAEEHGHDAMINAAIRLAQQNGSRMG